MKSKIFVNDFKYYLILGIKFGIVGSLIGFILHAIWGNFEEIKYTIFNGFLIGFFVGFFELIFSNSKVGRFLYSIILLFRTITYFLITIISVYSVLLFSLNNIGIELTSIRNDPQKLEQIQNVFFLVNINIIHLLVFTLIATFIWQLKSFFGKGVLFNYLTGKYHKPSIEDRIFMFETGDSYTYDYVEDSLQLRLGKKVLTFVAEHDTTPVEDVFIEKCIVTKTYNGTWEMATSLTTVKELVHKFLRDIGMEWRIIE